MSDLREVSIVCLGSVLLGLLIYTGVDYLLSDRADKMINIEIQEPANAEPGSIQAYGICMLNPPKECLCKNDRENVGIPGRGWYIYCPEGSVTPMPQYNNDRQKTWEQEGKAKVL